MPDIIEWPGPSGSACGRYWISKGWLLFFGDNKVWGKIAENECEDELKAAAEEHARKRATLGR